MKSNLFTALGVSAEIADALQAQGYTEPTPIQKEAIPIVMAGHDVIAQAQTGTGKTLAFVLPILEHIDLKKNYTQALIVTPTRELAIQITEEVQRWAPLKGISVLAAYGGQDVERQLKKLAGTIHVIIATPGRLLDHIRRETVQLQRLSTLVLDEADQMLHMGFLKDVEEIIIQTPVKRQTLLFSATMPGPIRNLAKGYMRAPQEIKVKTKQVTLTEIEQVVIKTTDRGKQDALCVLIDELNPYLAMIFCRTKQRATNLNEALQEMGYASDELHGDLTQAKREQVMKKFRNARIQLLVATDIASRGLDVEGITHVFNYDMPHDTEAYIHRIGRTGRAGQRGVAITMVTQRDMKTLDEIENGINAKLPRRTMNAEGELSAEQTSGRGNGRSSDTDDRVSMSTERTDRGAGNRRGGSRNGSGAAGAKRSRSGYGGNIVRAGGWREDAKPGRGRAIGGERGRAANERAGGNDRGGAGPGEGRTGSGRQIGGSEERGLGAVRRTGGGDRTGFGAGAGRSRAGGPRGGAAGRGFEGRPGANRAAEREYGTGETAPPTRTTERGAVSGRGQAAGTGSEAGSLSGLFGRGKGANRGTAERGSGPRGRGDSANAAQPERDRGEAGARRSGAQGGRNAGARDAGAWTTKSEAQRLAKAAGRGAGGGAQRGREAQTGSGKRGSAAGSGPKGARPGRKDSGPRGRGGR